MRTRGWGVRAAKPEAAIPRSPWFCSFCGTVEKREMGTAEGAAEHTRRGLGDQMANSNDETL